MNSDNRKRGMRRLARPALLATVAAIVCLALPQTAARRGGSVVDLELALAVDTSSSVDASEYRLQMEGLFHAFRDPAVIAAIRSTGRDGIAATVYHWSSSGEQIQIVPWTRLRDRVTAEAFAEAIRANYSRRFDDSTGIGDAIRFGAILIGRNRFEGRRKSIDVSGDGRNNSGIPPDLVRDVVIGQGITINGLAILNDEPFLHHYYYRKVIGGPSAFVMTAASYGDIINAMRNKLLREISVSIAKGPRGGLVPVAVLPR